MQSTSPTMRKTTFVWKHLLNRLLTTYMIVDIQVEQELWHTLCVSITLTWRSQCVNCSQLWTLLIIFVHRQKIAPIEKMFLFFQPDLPKWGWFLFILPASPWLIGLILQMCQTFAFKWGFVKSGTVVLGLSFSPFPEGQGSSIPIHEANFSAGDRAAGWP